MRARIGFLALGFFLMGSGVKAGLPRPVDTPYVRPQITDTHKRGYHVRKFGKYQRIEWGSLWTRIFAYRAPHITHLHYRDDP